MDSSKQDMVEHSFQELLNSVPPALAERLKEKYDADSKEFFEAVKEQTAGTDLPHWAKKNCGRCYGTGSLGTMHQFMPHSPARKTAEGTYDSAMTQELACKCTQKAYSTWLTQYRQTFNDNKGETNAE